MSTIENNLVLHLPLDEAINNSILDASANGHDGAAHGDVEFVADDVFGAVLVLDGIDDDVTAPHHADLEFGRDDDFAVMAWVRVDGTQQETDVTQLGIIEKWDGVGVNPYTFSLVYNHNTGKVHAGRGDGTLTSALDAVTSINDGAFHHIALIKRGYTLELYIDGVFDAQVTDDTDPGIGGAQIFIGARSGGAHHLTGLLSNVRLYAAAPTAVELLGIMEADKTAGAIFRREHPLEFLLIDDAAQQLLYIEDNPSGRAMTLQIRNTVSQGVEIQAPANTTASASNYHIEMRLRPGTLTPESQAAIAPDSGVWNYARVTHSNGEFSLYLLRTSALTLPADSMHTELIDFVGAGPHGGARGSRVEFHYDQVRYVGDSATLSGVRSEHLDIVNQLAQKNIPLHVGFSTDSLVGGDAVLNDGNAQNALLLRIANSSATDTISFWHRFQDSPTRFIVSFDVQGVGEDKEYALVNGSEAANIVCQAILPASGAPSHPIDTRFHTETIVQGESPEFIFTLHADLNLAPGEHFTLKIANIVTGMPSGPTNIYLRYENIKGYWDGQFVATTRKGPLAFFGSKVGIGTIAPLYELDVHGTLQAVFLEGEGAVPYESIVRWVGSNTPVGWQLCDGTNGTPNLNTPSETYIIRK